MNEAVDKMDEIIGRFEGPGFGEVWMAGSPVLQRAVIGSMQRDLPRFMGVMLLSIVVLLAALFRRASGVFLPLLVVLLAVAQHEYHEVRGLEKMGDDTTVVVVDLNPGGLAYEDPIKGMGGVCCAVL